MGEVRGRHGDVLIRHTSLALWEREIEEEKEKKEEGKKEEWERKEKKGREERQWTLLRSLRA